MSAKSRAVIACAAALLVVGVEARGAAQSPPAQPRRVAHPYIEINPRPLLYRRCTAWYVLQNRPSGPVLFPQQHCWWVRG